MPFQPGDDPNRHPLSAEERQKGLERQRDTFEIRRRIRSRYEDNLELADEVINALHDKATGVRMAELDDEGGTRTYVTAPDTPALKLIIESVDGPQVQKVEQTTREVPTYDLSKLSIEKREALLALIEEAEPNDSPQSPRDSG